MAVTRSESLVEANEETGTKMHIAVTETADDGTTRLVGRVHVSDSDESRARATVVLQSLLVVPEPEPDEPLPLTESAYAAFIKTVSSA